MCTWVGGDWIYVGGELPFSDKYPIIQKRDHIHSINKQIDTLQKNKTLNWIAVGTIGLFMQRYTNT